MNKLLLDKENAYLLDKMAIDKGASLSDLMETAGKRSAKVIINEIVPKIKNFNKKIYVVCGPGNNGGDGFVVAKYLKEEGISIRIHIGNTKIFRFFQLQVDVTRKICYRFSKF